MDSNFLLIFIVNTHLRLIIKEAFINDVLVISTLHVMLMQSISQPLSAWNRWPLRFFSLCSNYRWIISYEVVLWVDALLRYPVQPPLSVARWCGLAWRYRPEVTNLPTLSALKTYICLILLSLKTFNKSSPWFCRWKGLRKNIHWKNVSGDTTHSSSYCI